MEFHPDDKDLMNFAREELGDRKKARILAHCRECSDCANRLIEATREHAPPPPPFRLTRWNKIWLGALLLSLVALVATLALLMRSVQAPDAMLPPQDESQSERKPRPR